MTSGVSFEWMNAAARRPAMPGRRLHRCAPGDARAIGQRRGRIRHDGIAVAKPGEDFDAIVV